MSVVEQSPLADDVEPAPLESRRGQPHLRLIAGETHTGTVPRAPRLAVIVAADTVDYTRHMAADEAGTHARCTSLQRTILEPGVAEYGARVVKHTGDGFVAEFSSATRAVWFAVQFQDRVRAWNARRAHAKRLEFRIGINLGDVIVELHDVFGHSVNIAARLEAAAPPGGVLVSHAVFTSVRDPRLVFEDAGDFSLKNLSEPVRAFHASLAARARSRRPLRRLSAD